MMATHQKQSTDAMSIALDMIAPAYPALATMLKHERPAVQRELRNHFIHFEREFVRVRTGGHQPAGIAAGQHDMCDEQLSNMLARHPRAKDVTCRAGCSHCCYQSVHITDQEADLLRMVMARDGMPFDSAKAQRQAAYAPEAWFTQPTEDRGCVLLGADGRCTVYADRPLVCRKLYVVSKPEDCDTFKDLGHPIQVLADVRAEIVTAAAHVATEGGTLPRMLLAAKEPTP